MNHIGLWLVLVAASMGSADMQKLTMVLDEGKMVFTAFDENNQPRKLDFAIRLEDFNIEEFHPKIGVFDPNTSELINKKEILLEAEAGTSGKLGGWDVTIDKYHENSIQVPEGYMASEAFGAAPAALVTARNSATGEVKQGWLSAGSFMVPQALIDLGNNAILAMTIPQSKRYNSHVTLYHADGQQEDLTVAVNEPISASGWKIYQSGYDDSMGKWSTRSYLQLVKDPWLPAVYVGIFMIMAGAIYLFWMGGAKTKQ